MNNIHNKIARSSFYAATFSAPFFFFLPINFGISDIFFIISATFLVLSNRQLVFPDRLITISLLLILFGFSVSMINSQDIVEAMKFPLQFLFVIVIVFPVVFTLIDSWKEIYRHTLVLSGSLLIHVSYGIYFYFQVGITADRHRWTLFYSNPNTLATIVFFLTIITLLLAIYLYFEERKLFGMVLLSLSLGGVFLIIRTLSRRGMIAIFASLFLLYLIKLGFSNRFYPVAIRFAAAIPTIAIVGYLLYTVGFLPEGLLIRLEETLNYSDDGSTSARIVQHQVGLRSLSEFWLLGTGYNNFAVAANHAITPEEVAYMEGTSSPRVHNSWVIPFIEGGIFAGLGVLLLFGTLIVRTLRTWASGIGRRELLGFSYALTSSVYLLIIVFATLSNRRFYWLMIAIAFVGFRFIAKDDD